MSKVFSGGGHMGALIRSIDWGATRLGPAERWPASLRTMVGVMLGARHPMAVWWGPECLHLYNDAYRPILGDKHPMALGASGAEVWFDSWEMIAPMARGALAGAPAEDFLFFPVNRRGLPEETYFSASFSPIPDDDGHVGGLLVTTRETTAEVQDGRQLRTLRDTRAEPLAELDRAKTTFLSSISHEFRTPLTLMLGPIEDALARPEHALGGESLELTYRNSLRLLKLVNALLEFSQLEAGRVEARYESVHIAAFTVDLASILRSAIERAGLALEVSCEPPAEQVYVDREMWEQIVLNLLSNAFKFTFEGTIEVLLRGMDGRFELVVRDTGIGMSPHDLPRIFERFRRIEGAKARSYEGSGIGLALVQELVRLHGGEIRVDSEPGVGTTVTVTIRTGCAHLRADRIVPPRTDAARLVGTARVAAFVEEALHWTPDSRELPLDDAAPPEVSERVMVVDDSADLRDYLCRVLGSRWRVETFADGRSALEAAKRAPPDLVITDVMMPAQSGFDLLSELRRDARTQSVPVVMLSARAGEEARVEGLVAGADDYLIKPFSARELIARVGSQLALGAGRRERALLLARERAARQEAEMRRGEAESANRAKDEFMAMLGHELRNPLAPMLTAIELMRLRGMRSRELEILQRQVGHLTRLVDDLLDVSRTTRGKITLRRRDVEIADAVAKAIEISSPLLEQRRHHVEVRVSPRGLGVSVDTDRMAQVISNLLTNAAKYSAAGSRIVLSAARENSHVQLCVQDEGIGIAPEMLDRVFDHFVQQPQTLDRSKGGLGLGLAIVKSMVELHGGAVRAQSGGLGQGSQFVIDLPAIDLPAIDLGAPADLEPSRGEVVTRVDGALQQRILVVDDNLDVAETLKDALEALGHVVIAAHDGPSALRIVETFEPNVAVLDIGLPVMDGYELARRLRDLGASRAPRLVAVTGYGQDSDRQRSKAAGFERHLVKPINLRELERVVEELRS